MSRRRTVLQRKEKKKRLCQLHLEPHFLAELLHAHTALLDLFSRKVGVNPARLRLFHELLHAGPGGICLSDLALRLSVTPALVTRQVKDMEREGWVRRRSDSRDGRRSYIQLSGKGKREVPELHERAHCFEAALMADIKPEDAAVAVRVLSGVCEKLESWRRAGRFVRDTD